MLLSQLPRQLPFPLAKNLNLNLLNRKGQSLALPLSWVLIVILRLIVSAITTS